MATPDRVEELGNIGSELLFENDHVRVWNMVLEPGESCKMHRHKLDYVWVDVTDSTKELLWPGERRILTHKDGHVSYQTVGRKGRDYDTGIKNVGDSTSRQIVIEFVGQSATEEPGVPMTNGREGMAFPDGDPDEVKHVGAS